MDFTAFLTSIFYTYGLLGLGMVCFLSVSILPWPSEPFIIIATQLYDPWAVFGVVLVASVLSSTVNYWVGLKGIRVFFVKRDPGGEEKAYEWFDRWGSWALLFGPWLPFVGDVFPLAAGTVKMEAPKFFLVMVLARTIKTAAMVWFGVALSGIISL
ncbi:MAG: VTT domain-containing protein [Candidatus Micrarchaeia archaeon]